MPFPRAAEAWYRRSWRRVGTLLWAPPGGGGIGEGLVPEPRAANNEPRGTKKGRPNETDPDEAARTEDGPRGIDFARRHDRGGGADGDAAGVDPDAGQGRDAHRHARLQGRDAEQGDRRQGLRQPRLHPCLRGVREHLPGRQHRGASQGISERRGEGQRSPDLFRPDGRQLAVPDGQRGHDLYAGHARPLQGADGAGGRPRRCWAPSTTSGSAGSSTSGPRAPIAAREGST